MAFLKVKLLAENPFQGWKIDYFPKVEDHVVQKRGSISIKCLAYSQRVHCWFVVERFLVWYSKIGGVLDPEEAPGYHKIATCILKHS